MCKVLYTMQRLKYGEKKDPGGIRGCIGPVHIGYDYETFCGKSTDKCLLSHVTGPLRKQVTCKACIKIMKEMNIDPQKQSCRTCELCTHGAEGIPPGPDWGICKAPVPQWMAAFLMKDKEGKWLTHNIVHLDKDGGDQMSTAGISKCPCVLYNRKP